jgi:Tol biopolymer transport system component
MHLIETDPTSGAEIYQLTNDTRPADNIYGEQPYSPPESNRIAVRFYPEGDKPGGLSILDLEDGSVHPVIKTSPRFPAFHAWGDYLYCQEESGQKLILKRWHYQTLQEEEVISLPTEEGGFSYGTVSPDHRFYAASVNRDGLFRVLLIELSSGRRRTLADSPDQLFKHEQFSLDGRNRVLIQANGPGVKVVNLGVMELDGEGIDWLPVDAPPVTPVGRWPGGDRYTPRCTGHEAWIGRTARVFLSTGYDKDAGTNLWTAAVGDSAPSVVWKTALRFGHVSASRCGTYWVADTSSEEGVPIYIGAFGSGRGERAVVSRTTHDGQQWSHTHPYLTADNRWLVYTSTRSGLPQVYGARLPESFLARL